jgi:hypothetical protein
MRIYTLWYALGSATAARSEEMQYALMAIFVVSWILWAVTIYPYPPSSIKSNGEEGSDEITVSFIIVIAREE